MSPSSRFLRGGKPDGMRMALLTYFRHLSSEAPAELYYMRLSELRNLLIIKYTVLRITDFCRCLP